METLKFTDIDTIKNASKAFAVNDFRRFLQREGSGLSALAKVQVGREAELYLRERGLGR